MIVSKYNIYFSGCLRPYLICSNANNEIEKCLEEFHVEESLYSTYLYRHLSKYSLHPYDKTNLCIWAVGRPLLDG